MKKALVFFMALLSLALACSYCGAQSAPEIQQKTIDVNKDGTPDVIYHQRDNSVTKIEADTNYDGKSDVTVNLENGKFKSAEADTNYDGKLDKTFDNAADFNAWLNKDKPDFNDSLGFSEDGTFTALRF